MTIRMWDCMSENFTCLFAGLRPQERRTVCLPIVVPFSFCNASSALFLKKVDAVDILLIKNHVISEYAKIWLGQDSYLFANCTKPHPFPTGILTETISPYWENGCLRSSSETLGSSPPTNIYNKSLVSHSKVVVKSKLQALIKKNWKTHSCVCRICFRLVGCAIWLPT